MTTKAAIIRKFRTTIYQARKKHAPAALYSLNNAEQYLQIIIMN